MKLFSRFVSFLYSKQTNAIILKVLIVLAILLVFAIYQRKYNVPRHTEGFTQNEKYSLKRDDAVYDSFYAGIYDYLHKTEKRCPYELRKIVESTQPDKETSTILDVGCGSGCMVDALREAGYRAVGIDKSAAMVDVAKRKYPAASVRKCNAMDSMEFERESFTHVLCLNQTIYEFADKIAFLRNCYHWLVPGGYLIVHVVDPARFDTVVPVGKPAYLEKPLEQATERITDTSIDFKDFKYKSAYDFSNVDRAGVVVHTETFTDKETGHIRENERTIQYESEKDILEKVRFCRFLPQGKFDMKEYNGDANQSVYIFEKL